MSQNSDELVALVVEKAQADADFRAALIADPKAALQSALGITIPDALSVRVIEEGASEVVLVLPAAGKDVALEELAVVAGGDSSTWGPHCQSC